MTRLFACALLWLLPLAGWPQDSRPPVKVMLVLDASGSMWGQIDERPKIEIAREVLGDLLSLWDSSHQVGLTAYGHRRKGDCDDIETLVPVGGTADAIRNAADTLNPKGKTPISASVIRAAEALSYTEDAATVILISDGAETCDADPCAVGRALEEKGVDFTAHVVGFDVDESEQSGLRCLAEATGGVFLAAENAATLSEALTKTVEKTRSAEPAPQPPKTEIGPVSFRALYADGGPQIERGISWEVFEAASDPEGKREKVAFSYKTEPSFELAPGAYVLTLKVGAASTEIPLEITTESGGTQDVVLNAGLLRMQGLRTDGGDPIAKGTSWEVLSAEGDMDEKSRKVTFSYSDQPLFTLPEGRYRVLLKVGSAVGEADVTVIAGERSEDKIVLDSGIAAVNAVLAEGQQPVGKLSWDVFTAATDIEGKRSKVTFSYSDNPQWELAAGRYLIRAKRGEGIGEVELDVTAGQRSEAQVVLDAGVLNASSSGGSGSHTWDVYQADPGIDGKRQKMAFSYSAEPQWTLPAGEYVVVLKRGSLIGEVQVSLTPGQITDATVTLEQGAAGIGNPD